MLKRVIKKNKFIFILIILIIILIFVFLGAKFALYFNFLLGNDIIVKLDANKEYLSLKHGEEETIEFKAKVTTNPFCTASCASEFFDISQNKTIEKDEFNLKPGLGVKKDYILKAPEKGKGILLYRFNMECNSINSLLCHTSEEKTTRNILVVVNYTLTEDEEGLKEITKNDIFDFVNQYNEIKKKIIILENSFSELNKNVIVNKNEINESIGEEIINLKDLWENEEFLLLNANIGDLAEEVKNVVDLVNNFENETLDAIYRYNSLIDNLNNFRDVLENSTDNETTERFNEVVKLFIERNTIEEKEANVNSLDLTNVSLGNESLFFLEEVNFSKIIVNENVSITSFELELKEPESKCCVFGNCESCCLDCEDKDYPIVFLHGHAVSESLSIEYSLEGFNKLQKKMENGLGYLNAGTITVYSEKNSPEGSLGQMNVPLTIRGTYYYDVFEEPENYVIVQKKSENIDTYAVRLKEVIDIIKYKTGKDKVNIISFSMGGLVTRRYIQIFGNDNVGKVILLGSPNKGIVGEVKSLCPVTGSTLECNDMNEDSIFMNKLNKGSFPDVIMHNIYGTGCKMSDGMGDGIVLEKNAKLEKAENYVINGKCRGIVQPLHLDLLDIDRYPEVYEIMKGILNETN